jgi:hypothetical protein
MLIVAVAGPEAHLTLALSSRRGNLSFFLNTYILVLVNPLDKFSLNGISKTTRGRIHFSVFLCLLLRVP